MFFNKSFKNKASIASKSNNNFIVQDSQIANLIVCNNSSNLIELYGANHDYKAIQNYVIDAMEVAKHAHPLYPDYSVTFHSKLNRLVSVPLTENAMIKYPKRIKSTFTVDPKKYPYMDKSETPWDYAYRTQTPIEVETKAYREYLGDEEDPFPIVEYCDGMTTVIMPPEFPPPFEAILKSGEVSIPIMLHRVPCMEYGIHQISTFSDEYGFSINLFIDEKCKNARFKLVKIPGADLSVQLQRERLINEFSRTKNIVILVGESNLLNGEITDDDMPTDLFAEAPYLIRYLDSLLTIEKYTSCKFDPNYGDVYKEDYIIANVLAASLKGDWHPIITSFDDELRCDYDKIPDNLGSIPNSISVIEGQNVDIDLQGQHFHVGKYTRVYKDAKVNNLSSVNKNRKKKRKNILITFRPAEGKDTFYKYCKFEDIKLML